MPQHKSIFSNLERVADSVVALFGKNCEACIHDLTSLQNSLVYITGDVTGRKLGAPATDLLIRKLQQDGSNPRDIHNYKTTTNDGRSLKSSTTFIKDKNGQPIAAFCINFDTTEFYNASQALIPLLNLTGKEPPDNNETFSHSATETIEEVFNQGVGEVGKHPATMSVDEKTQLITYLEENGVFQLKGSVEEVGHLMGVTKFTVYNYLKKIRNHELT
ncbi:MAG: putative transcriptional regulator YheO [Desulforhopalus sp.]|jgi:predicted transcriptional regulator YheO